VGDTRLHLLVAVVFHNAASTLASAVDSVFGQVGGSFRVTLLLVNDASTDDWRGNLGKRLERPDVRTHNVAFRSAARARNFVLEEADRSLDVDYVCRLDADDTLATSTVFSELTRILRQDHPDVLLAGNLQVLDGEVLTRPNLATPDLLDPTGLLERLDRMARGDPTAELPSCNTVVRRGLAVRYPLVPSAEDHWYMTTLLLQRGRLRVVVASDLVYAIYHLRGRLTCENLARETYLESRRALAGFARATLTDGGPDGAA
jgi:glycosyltransferase involved in cell wall biosynthesis